jgi:hypothetical protein
MRALVPARVTPTGSGAGGVRPGAGSSAGAIAKPVAGGVGPLPEPAAAAAAFAEIVAASDPIAMS